MSQTIKVVDPVENISIILPSGEKIVLQYRDDGGTFPSLDICFEQERVVQNWSRGMESAKVPRGNPAHIRRCFQLWVGLDPKGESYFSTDPKAKQPAR